MANYHLIYGFCDQSGIKLQAVQVPPGEKSEGLLCCAGLRQYSLGYTTLQDTPDARIGAGQLEQDPQRVRQYRLILKLIPESKGGVEILNRVPWVKETSCPRLH